MDRFLFALLTGFLAGVSCGCFVAYSNDADESNDQWPAVGYLLGAIGGFVLLVFGLISLLGNQ
jgi:hypothetical protein